MNRAEIQAVANQHLTPENAERFVASCRDAALFSAGIGSRSRLGGHPTVDMEQWPSRQGRPLSFLASMALSDLSAIQTDLELPADGTLGFFYDTDEEHQPWGIYPEDHDGWKVVYTEPGKGVQHLAPTGAVVFDDVAITPRQIVTAPTFEELVVQEISTSQRSELISIFAVVSRSTWAAEANHQIGGWPYLQQGPIWRDAQFGLHGIAYNKRRGNADPAVEALRETLDDWQLLCQIDSDERAGWMWGDCGTLYFSIRKQDLAARRFDRCWMSLQCG